MERVIIPGSLDKEHSCPISLRLTYRQAGRGLWELENADTSHDVVAVCERFGFSVERPED